ncbi:MAG: DUF481 domain-containing protein [Oligoflexia bacterium]|nr:DUF481 domain-containing protein [Oligoflexia bacterium]
MRKTVLFIVLTFSAALYGIVDTESKYSNKLKDNPWLFRLGGGFTQRSGNSQNKQIDLDSVVIYKVSKSQILLANDGSYGFASGQTNTNRFFSYLKYTYEMKENLLSLESFSQIEFDEFKGLLFRGLMGFGVKFFAYADDNYQLVLRVAHMPEYEKYSNGEKGWAQRLSNNIIFSYIGSDIFSGDLVLYYQPRYDRWTDDYRVASELQVSLKIIEHLSFRFSYLVSFDSEPIEGVRSTDSTIKNSLVLEFAM